MKDNILKHVLDDNTELFRRSMKLLNQYHDTDDKLKEALSLLESYSEELERMIERDQTYAQLIRKRELTALQTRHAELLEKVKGEQKPLTDTQKKYVKLFLAGQCTDGYLMTKLGFEWKEVDKLIEQYKREEGKNE